MSKRAVNLKDTKLVRGHKDNYPLERVYEEDFMRKYHDILERR